MNLLKKYVSTFFGTYFNEFYYEIGDKILFKEKNENRIHIVNNRKHNLKWGFIFIALGIGLFIYLGRHFLYKLEIGSFLMLFLVTSPALGLGIYYLIKSKSKLSIVFDIKNSQMFISNNKTINFSNIKELNFTHLESFRGPTSYHLNLNYGNKELTLFKSEDKQEIYESGRLLSGFLKVWLNETFKEA